MIEELGNVFKKYMDEYSSVRVYITNLTLINCPTNDNYIVTFMPIFNFATSESNTILSNKNTSIR